MPEETKQAESALAGVDSAELLAPNQVEYLEDISDKIRRGEPVSMVEALCAIKYQEGLKSKKPPSLLKRIFNYFFG